MKNRFRKKIRHIIIACRSRSAAAEKKINEIKKFLNRKSVSSEVFFQPEAREISSLKGDLILSLGGDGSYLKAAKFGGSAPVLGINVGSLGFLTPYEGEKAISVLESALSGRLFSKRNHFLEANLYRLKSGASKKAENHQDALAAWNQARAEKPKKTFYSINETAIERGELSRLISFSVYINKQYIYSSKSDGLIVATPIGSTAYSLAAGGPILHPEVQSMVITPICSHSLTTRPIVIHDKSEILLRVHEGAFFAADGEEREPLSPLDALFVKKSEKFFVSLTEKEESEFPLLRKKLKFGQRD